MGLLDWLNGRGGDEQERPPKPDAEQVSKTKDVDVYDATVHYRNGDTETFETFGIKSEQDEYIKFNTAPIDLRHWNGRYGEPDVYLSYDDRREMWEVLSRQPVLEPLETRSYEITFTVDYHWKDRRSWQPEPSQWEPHIASASFERID